MTELSEKHYKILIVDDKPENLGLLFSLLNNSYEVYAAENGKVALEIMDENLPDLILLDIMMPVMDGFTFCEKIKSDSRTENIPVIFMSALSETVDKVKGFELGAVDYIVKPINQEEVLSRVKTQLSIVEYQKKLKDLNRFLDKKVRERTQQLEEKIEEVNKMNVALQESENRYRTLFANAPEAIVLIDVNSGNVTSCNPAACTLFGYEQKEMIGLNQKDIFLNNASDDTKNINRATTSLNKNDDKNFLNNIITKTGKRIPVESSAKIVAVDGQLLLQGIIHDVSERKIIEEQLKAAKENAEEMNSLKSNFLANMSHELRTPLIGILGFSQFLTEEIEDEEILSMIEIIHSGGKRLLDTLNLLLDISQIERGKISITEKIVSINSVLSKIYNDFASSTEDKGLELRANIPNELCRAILDQQMLETVLTNLLANSVKFTESGYVELELNKARIEDQSWIQIIVRDTGIGIEEQELEKIFSEFRQASEGTTRDFDGIGLGLTVSKKYVEFFKGKIEVNSMPGKGTEFIIYLPELNEKNIDIIQKYKSSTRVIDVDHLIRDDKKTIGYLEFDFASREFAKLILKKDYNLISFDNAEQLIDSVNNTRYDIILIDVSLESALAGLEVVQVLTEFEALKNTPKVAVSAFTQRHQMENILSKGFTHYLAKPFGKSDLLELIEKL